MTTQDVQKAILEPMTATFAPPKHLLFQPELQERALREYERSLAVFEREVLEQVWRTVCGGHRYKVWPTPATFVKVALALHKNQRTGPPLEAKQTEALALADAYVARYCKTSQLAKQAQRDGWLNELRHYVTEAAWVQAQMLVGIERVSYDSILLRHSDIRSPPEAIAAFQETVRPHVEAGKIKVNVPAVYLQEWKQRAETTGKARGE